MVMHPASVKGEPAVSEVGLARFDCLMKTANRLGVTVASENINGTKLLTHLLNRYPQMRFCWDVGHEPCFSSGVEFMPLFGNRIGAFHLHDNHGIPGEDEHLLPYDGTLDMDRAARQLAESGYTGSIMLEYAATESFYAHLDADAFYARAAMQARKFADRVDFYQGK